jgi:hypothetical protein
LIGQIWKSGDTRRRLVLISRGLDGYFYLLDARFIGCCVVLKAREERSPPLLERSPGCRFRHPRARTPDKFPVAIARGKHLFPFRTEPLSPSAPMVLGPQGPGRVGRRRFFCGHCPVSLWLAGGVVFGVVWGAGRLSCLAPRMRTSLSAGSPSEISQVDYLAARYAIGAAGQAPRHLRSNSDTPGRWVGRSPAGGGPLISCGRRPACLRRPRVSCVGDGVR